MQAERDKRQRDADTRAYTDTIAAHGMIPRVILDEPDQDAQRKRLLTEQGDPACWTERVIITPPPAVELPGAIRDNPQLRDVTPPKSFVDQNVAHLEHSTEKPRPSDPGANAVLCVAMTRGTPVFYSLDPGTRMLTLCEPNGA